MLTLKDFLPETKGCSSGGCGTTATQAAPYGIVKPYMIQRTGPADPAARIKPLFCVPTLSHIEITYACMEDCLMCYNPTRTKVSQRDKDIVWEIVRSLGQSRVPHTYLIGGEPTYGYSKTELQDYVEFLSDNGSSVTLVTNGQIRLKGMTQRLACYGVSIHGADAETHDSITRVRGSWKRAIETARHYVEEGHDVRIIPVVLGRNHDQMYRIAEIAWAIGAEAIYYDTYEPGGIGEENSHVEGLRLQPTYAELKTAIGQIIKAHDDFPFKGSIGLGTALPYCFDEGLVERGMLANCGVGSYFSAITNVGDFRICNQSKMGFGNVRQTPIEDIWMSSDIDTHFRSLQWVEEPCSSCPVLEECGGGCKVDEGCASGEFCIDRVVRGLSPDLKLRLQQSDIRRAAPKPEAPAAWRKFRLNRYFALTGRYADRGDIFFKTRYQTVRIGENEKTILESMQEAGGTVHEGDLVHAYRGQVDEAEIRRFVNGLERVDAIDLVS